MLRLIVFSLIIVSTAQAEYVQTFNIKAAIPVYLHNHRQAGFTSSDWIARVVVLQAAEGISLGLNCESNAVFLPSERKYLRVSTSFALGYNEQNLKAFLIEMRDKADCVGLIEQIVNKPTSYQIKILNGDKAEVEKVDAQ